MDNKKRIGFTLIDGWSPFILVVVAVESYIINHYRGSLSDEYSHSVAGLYYVAVNWAPIPQIQRKFHVRESGECEQNISHKEGAKIIIIL